MSSMQNSDTTNGGEENNPMTIDDMKACYSQADVEDAMFTRNYVEYRNKEIKKLQDDIETAKSSNDVAGVEHLEKCLRDYKAETPSLPPIDPTERGDLDADVLWRIRVLKYQIYPDSSDFLRENINAILNAYRRGELKLDFDQVTVWFAGRLVYGPVPRKNFNLGAMVMKKGRGFYEKYGPGTLWAEPNIPVTQKMIRARLTPQNEFHHHMFSVKVRGIGLVHEITVHDILDDTRSSYFELFGRDLTRLQLPPDYPNWLGTDIMDTANGRVERRILNVEVQLLLDGVPFGQFVQTTSFITPRSPAGSSHCSGMFLRSLFFTATCPDGRGMLYVSDKKTGVTGPLPAV